MLQNEENNDNIENEQNNEVKYFHKKIVRIRKYFQGQNIKLNFWFVTNTRNMPISIKQFCKRNKIELKEVKMHTNWKRRANWNILELKSI